MAAAADESIALSMAPAYVRDHPILARWYAIPEERRGIAVSVLFASLIFIPWLGAVGFWDPWEGHYSEVARQMLVRNDYVYPYWESAYFFSKPVLLFWMAALSMNLIGVHSNLLPPGSDPTGVPPSGLSMYLEWAIRLPVAVLAIAAVAFVYIACARLISRRVGLLAAAALATMPFYSLMARQAITDMPFVALMTCGTMAFAIAIWDERAHRSAWAYTGYVFLAFATLAKGLLGFGLTGAIFLAWFLFTGHWEKIARLRLAEKIGGRWIPIGPAIFLAIAAPWYVVLSLFQGVDDESHTFAYRFWIWDHLKRLGQGVHTTTPGGTFTYFIEQLGFGIFPWVVALPGGLAELMRVRVKDRDPATQMTILCSFWAAIGFVLMSLSATKFHHYIFPIVPALAVLCAIWIDRVWREGLEEHMIGLALGAALFAVVAQNLWLTPKHFVDLFVYNYERPYPDKEIAALHPGINMGPLFFSMAPRAVFSSLFTVGGCALIAAFLWRSRKWVVGGFVIFATVFSLYLSWFHWRELSPHWSQRDIFWAYLEQRATPEEPIAAYYMNWRGETFYSRNLVRQIQDTQKIRDFVGRPGREWIIVEQTRFAGLKSTLGENKKLRIVDRSDNKFYLVAAED